MSKRPLSSRARTLGWILTDKTGKHAWAGPGLTPIGVTLDLSRVKLWAQHESAATAARALNSVLSLDLRPTPLLAP